MCISGEEEEEEEKHINSSPNDRTASNRYREQLTFSRSTTSSSSKSGTILADDNFDSPD